MTRAPPIIELNVEDQNHGAIGGVYRGFARATQHWNADQWQSTMLDEAAGWLMAFFDRNGPQVNPGVARSLKKTRAEMASALYGFAVELDPTSVQTRWAAMAIKTYGRSRVEHPLALIRHPDCTLRLLEDHLRLMGVSAAQKTMLLERCAEKGQIRDLRMAVEALVMGEDNGKRTLMAQVGLRHIPLDKDCALDMAAMLFEAGGTGMWADNQSTTALMDAWIDLAEDQKPEALERMGAILRQGRPASDPGISWAVQTLADLNIAGGVSVQDPFLLMGYVDLTEQERIVALTSIVAGAFYDDTTKMLAHASTRERYAMIMMAVSPSDDAGRMVDLITLDTLLQHAPDVDPLSALRGVMNMVANPLLCAVMDRAILADGIAPGQGAKLPMPKRM